MNFEPEIVYHIFNQGNNKQQIFFRERNYLYFMEKMREYMLPYVDVLCYCLMPNHFHFLVVVNKVSTNLENGKKRDLNFSIGLMLRSYTNAINKQENRSGSLFRPHTKAKNGIIDGFVTIGSKHEDLMFQPGNGYAMYCFNYIHENPVRANLALKPEDWPYSSASDYAGIRKGTLCNQKRAKILLSL